MKTAEEILTDITKNRVAPQGYSLNELSLFYTVRNLISLFNAKQISKEEASEQKQAAIQAFEMTIQVSRDTEMLRGMLRGALKGDRLPEALSIAVEIVERYSGEHFE